MLIGLCGIILLSWVTFHVLFKNHSIETLKEALQRSELWLLLPGLGCMLLFVNCEAANIRMLMRTFGAFPTGVPCPMPLLAFISAPLPLQLPEDSPCSFII